jgi:hypothetical protein
MAAAMATFKATLHFLKRVLLGDILSDFSLLPGERVGCTPLPPPPSLIASSSYYSQIYIIQKFIFQTL